MELSLRQYRTKDKKMLKKIVGYERYYVNENGEVFSVKKNKTREEELELENLKLKVEVARLKKGYQVKGVGSKKEYVTIKDLNTKS